MILIGKPELNRPLGTPKLRWVDDIKMDPGVMGIEWGRMDWIDLAQDKDNWTVLMNAVMNLRVQ
jgi:hypothetical protein